MTASKRSVGYSNVQPFDTKFLLEMFASEHIDPEDFKFISWKDFDIALESDEQLFKKLIELAKTNKEVAALNHNFSFDHFIPIQSGTNGAMYYRTERSDKTMEHDLTQERV